MSPSFLRAELSTSSNSIDWLPRPFWKVILNVPGAELAGSPATTHTLDDSPHPDAPPTWFRARRAFWIVAALAPGASGVVDSLARTALTVGGAPAVPATPMSLKLATGEANIVPVVALFSSPELLPR